MIIRYYCFWGFSNMLFVFLALFLLTKNQHFRNKYKIPKSHTKITVNTNNFTNFVPKFWYIMYIKVENIDQFNHYFHQPTYHPLVSVGRLQDADLSLFVPTDFQMYCVVLMEVGFGELVLPIPGSLFQKSY